MSTERQSKSTPPAGFTPSQAYTWKPPKPEAETLFVAEEPASPSSPRQNNRNCLFTPKNPAIRTTGGLSMMIIGAGLGSLNFMPPYVMSTLSLASLSPLALNVLLAVGIVLAAVGTFMFITGLVASCKQARQDNQPYRYLQKNVF